MGSVIGIVCEHGCDISPTTGYALVTGVIIWDAIGASLVLTTYAGLLAYAIIFALDLVADRWLPPHIRNRVKPWVGRHVVANVQRGLAGIFVFSAVIIVAALHYKLYIAAHEAPVLVDRTTGEVLYSDEL